jgi:phosphatidylinositol glycan class T
MLCTENLAPLIKLLPCRSKAGLAMLLEPTVVFASDFTSIGLEVTTNREGAMTMALTTTMVLDRVENIQQQKQHRCCPRATSSIIQLNKPAWGELRAIAEQDIETDDTSTMPTIDVSREPDDIKCEGHCWIYNDAADTQFLNVPRINHPRPKNWQEHDMNMVPNPVNIRRTLTGTGRVKGGLVTEITNIGGDFVDIQYLDVIPWYLQIYTHTLRVTWNENVVANGAWRAKNFTSNFQVRPTHQEGPPSTMESTLTMAPGDVLRVEIQFLLVFLQFEQFPPDANRGFDIPSAIVQVRRKKKTGHRPEENSTFTTMYTSSLMIEMPYPDFSMPYNVITLTSTLMAFVGGTVLNMLSRKWKPPQDD